MQALWLSLLLGTPIPDFTLTDLGGRPRTLGEWRSARLVVVVFLGNGCPLAKLYARKLTALAKEYGPRGVVMLGVNANRHDGPLDIARFARQHEVGFPLLRDAGQQVADLLGATRTPEVFLLDDQRVVRYRGRIDDQYTVEAHRARETRRDLAEAVEELLAGQAVTRPVTSVSGCLIDRRQAAPAGQVRYHEDVAPILHRSCVRCHRPGQVAPFALTGYRDALAWAETIAEVVAEGRMPPWHASPDHGRFANDPRLSDADRRLIRDWVKGGCVEGDPARSPRLPAQGDGWNIPTPDVVVRMPVPFQVPAEGVVEYQHIEVDPGFTEDRWVRAAEVRPGNRAVVHHCTVFLKPPGHDEPRAQGKLGSHCLDAWAPGTPPLSLPDGMAKRVPAGWRIVFVMHYTPVGSPQSDQTSIGLVFADPQSVRREVATHLLYDDDLRIPPHAADHRTEKTWQAPADVLLLSMFPHMHLRGKSFRYEAHYPDGRREVLLDVPRYDFNWQHRYVLAEPRRLPAGTRVRCEAVYDNSKDNPANPDPDQEVRAGKQSWDEMFNGYFDWALAEEDLTAESRWSPWRLLLLLPALALVGLVCRLRARSVNDAKPVADAPGSDGRSGL